MINTIVAYLFLISGVVHAILKEYDQASFLVLCAIFFLFAGFIESKDKKK